RSTNRASYSDSVAGLIANLFGSAMSFVQKHFDSESISKLSLLGFVLLVLAALPACAQGKISTQPDAKLRAAICPIVYPYDKAAGSKGFRFTFFGNAFFINSQ